MRMIKRLPAQKNKHGKPVSFSLFYCDHCKSEVVRHNAALKSRSCGCVGPQLSGKTRTIHGEGHNKKTKLYRVWTGMKERCYNSSHNMFHRYGGRGIRVYSGWLNDYPCFKEFALSHGYEEGLQIDRINNDGHYYPSNIRFVTAEVNMRNTSTVKITQDLADQIRSEYATKQISQKGLATRYGVSQGLIGFIVRNERWISNGVTT